MWRRFVFAVALPALIMAGCVFSVPGPEEAGRPSAESVVTRDISGYLATLPAGKAGSINATVFGTIVPGSDGSLATGRPVMVDNRGRLTYVTNAPVGLRHTVAFYVEGVGVLVDSIYVRGVRLREIITVGAPPYVQQYAAFTLHLNPNDQVSIVVVSDPSDGGTSFVTATFIYTGVSTELIGDDALRDDGHQARADEPISLEASVTAGQQVPMQWNASANRWQLTVVHPAINPASDHQFNANALALPSGGSVGQYVRSFGFFIETPGNAMRELHHKRRVPGTVSYHFDYGIWSPTGALDQGPDNRLASTS